MTISPTPITLEEVRDFWEAHPCGSDTVHAADRLAYFLGVERYRYQLAPWIPEAAGFKHHAGKRVLEIGTGLGTDGAQFAAAGARYVGVDLTPAAIDLARENFMLRGLSGQFMTANAEELPFDSATFDHVYSFGVIHHSPDPPAIVREIRRVLAPGGTVTIMLYNRHSINYWLEIMLLRRVGRILLRPKGAPRFFAKSLGLPRATLEGHRRQLLRIRRPSREQWISMNTDGPACPLARVYSAREACALFAGFTDVQTSVFMFDRSHWPFVGTWISDSAAHKIGRRAGWNRMVFASRP